MFAACLTVTVLGAVLNGAAAVTYLIGHEYPKTQADMKGLPLGSRNIVGGIVFLGTATAALVLGLEYHGPW